MKKGILFAIIFCITRFSFSQIGLISTDFGSVGDSVIFSVDEFYVGNIFLGETGENKEWDFEFLSSSSKDTLYFIDPQTTSAGSIAGSNLVLRSNFTDTHWENNPHNLLIKAVGFEFDFSFIDSTDTIRTIYVEYKDGIHQAEYYMEYDTYYNKSTTGKMQEAIKDTFQLDTFSIYIDSFRVIDNVTILDSINGYGTLLIPNDSLECLRQDIRIKHDFDVEIKILDPFFGIFMIWVPLTDFIEFPIPGLNEHYIRYWAKGQSYPVLEFTLDSTGEATNTQYLFNTVEYIASNNEYTSNNLKIYPNPTNDIITINFNNKNLASIQLFDVLGKSIHQFTTHQNTFSIDLSSYEKGIYFLQVENEEGKTIERIIKN